RNGMPSRKLLPDTAKKLRESSQGLAGVAERVRRDFLCELKDSGLVMHVRGDDREIVELAAEALEMSVNDSRSNATKTLGPHGTVIWMFRDRDAKHIQHLFAADLADVRQIRTVAVTLTPDEFNPMLLEIKCDQKVYGETREKPLARQFERRLVDGRVYCRMYFGKELVFFGKIFSQVQAAMADWDHFRDQEMGKLCADTVSRKFTRSLPVPVLSQLRRQKGGMKPLIHKLRNDFLLDIDYVEGEDAFKLMSDIGDVVDMAYDLLCSKVKTPNARTDRHRMLGTRGTVIWTYKDNLARHFKHLFQRERDMLKDIKSTYVRFSPSLTNPLSVEIKCEQFSYEIVNKIMQTVEQDLMACKSRSLPLERGDRQLAALFERMEPAGRFYCRVLFSGRELTFFARNDAATSVGISEWHNFKRTQSDKVTREERENRKLQEKNLKEQEKRTARQRLGEERRAAREKQEEERRLKQQAREEKQARRKVKFLPDVKEENGEETSEPTASTSKQDLRQPAPTVDMAALTCPVCKKNYVKLSEAGTRLMTTKCKHIVCQPCIEKANSGRKGCPVCKTKLLKSDLNFVTLLQINPGH
ncbi:hypothetical protein MAR_014950, partial [Mya arenaria]